MNYVSHLPPIMSTSQYISSVAYAPMQVWIRDDRQYGGDYFRLDSVFIWKKPVKQIKKKSLHDFWPHIHMISNYLLVLTNVSRH